MRKKKMPQSLSSITQVTDMQNMEDGYAMYQIKEELLPNRIKSLSISMKFLSSLRNLLMRKALKSLLNPAIVDLFAIQLKNGWKETKTEKTVDSNIFSSWPVLTIRIEEYGVPTENSKAHMEKLILPRKSKRKSKEITLLNSEQPSSILETSTVNVTRKQRIKTISSLSQSTLLILLNMSGELVTQTKLPRRSSKHNSGKPMQKKIQTWFQNFTNNS